MNIILEFDTNNHDNVKKCPSFYQHFAEPLASDEPIFKNTELNNVKKKFIGVSKNQNIQNPKPKCVEQKIKLFFIH